MKEKTYRRISAVRKAGEILKHLGQTKAPASGPEIAAAVGLAQGTALCYLWTLEDIGFVQRIGERWRIGTGLALIWARAKANLEGEKMLIESQIKELGPVPQQTVWIPASAGMTDGEAGATGGGIGMTNGGAGMTDREAGMTNGGAGMTVGGTGIIGRIVNTEMEGEENE